MLNVAFAPSRQLLAWLIALHVTAGLCWLAVPLPKWGHGLGIALLGASTVDSVVRYALLRLNGSIVGLNGDRDGKAQLLRHDGQMRDAQVLGDTFVTPYLTLIRLKPRMGRSQIAIVLPDAIAPEAYRQMRVWLKWRAGKGAAEDAGGWATRV